MMTHAYREIYLSNAQAALGDAFDYAINTCNIPGKDFVKLFCVSSVSRRIENGEPSIIAGKSGIEIAIEVVLETTGKQLDTPESRASTARAQAASPPHIIWYRTASTFSAEQRASMRALAAGSDRAATHIPITCAPASMTSGSNPLLTITWETAS